MLPSNILDKIINFYPRTLIKNQYGGETESIITSSGYSTKGYLTRESFSPKYMGKEMNSYTHLLYTNQLTADVMNSDYIVNIDSDNYEIVGYMDTFQNHHMEFELKIMRNK